MTTQTQKLFVLDAARPTATSSAAGRRERWFVALAIAALFAGLAALARPVEKGTAAFDDHIPSLLID